MFFHYHIYHTLSYIFVLAAHKKKSHPKSSREWGKWKKGKCFKHTGAEQMRLPVCSCMKYELSETRSLIFDLPKCGIEIVRITGAWRDGQETFIKEEHLPSPFWGHNNLGRGKLMWVIIVSIQTLSRSSTCPLCKSAAGWRPLVGTAALTVASLPFQSRNGSCE